MSDDQATKMEPAVDAQPIHNDAGVGGASLDGPAAPTETESGNDHADAKATDAPAQAASEAHSATKGDGADGTGAVDTAAKKKEKRKSSSSVPEHKSKKLNKKKSMTLQLDAEPGKYYWHRLKGYPPWPSIICDDEILPEKLLHSRPVTAKRPDGSYREDFQEGGKSVKDRTYPVMYLGTYEFAWASNTDLTPLQVEDVQNAEAKGKKLSKKLLGAYVEAAQEHDLPYFKNRLAEAERIREEAEAAWLQEQEEKAKAAAEKQAKKENKPKRKSKAANDDVVMEDADGTPKGVKASGSKKRRKEADTDEDQPVKTPKTIKLSNAAKTPNGDSATKAKSKPAKASATKSAAKNEPQLSEAEKRDKRQKEILYFRHKLQKGLLPRGNEPPREEDMAQMAQYFDNLEKYKDLQGDIIRETRIHKVLKGILKLTIIPLDHKYNFKERSMKLLSDWKPVLGESEPGPTDSKTEAEGGKSGGEDGRPESKAESAAAPSEAEKPAEAEKAEEEETKEPVDVPMSDAKPSEPQPTKDVSPETTTVEEHNTSASAADANPAGNATESTAVAA